MVKWTEPKENEWIIPICKGYKTMCCDCKLVHDMDFRVFKGRIQIRFRRNYRSTALARRKTNKKKKENNYLDKHPNL